MSFRCTSLLTIAIAVAACQSESKKVAPLPTTTVVRGDINVRVQATGTVEPINPVDIKSKAGGSVIKEPVEVGNIVKPGDLLAQIDPRDATNNYQKAVADDVVADATLDRVLRDK